MFYLTTDRLRVELAEPGEPPNNLTRFDRAAYISEVTLDGSIRFCATEPRSLWHPATGGRGLCCEYRADYSGEARQGEPFPKLGVGLITRPDGETYRFYRRYRDVTFFPVACRFSEHEAIFQTRALPCLDIAMESEKRITVRDNVLTLSCEVRNTGARPIETEEYCHNFISVDGMAVSDKYRLDLPKLSDIGTGVLLDHEGKPCNFTGERNILRLARMEEKTSMAYLNPQLADESLPFTWTLAHEGAGASVVGADFVSVCEVLIWSNDHMVCPEIVQKICIQPGETHSWTRRFLFDADER